MTFGSDKVIFAFSGKARSGKNSACDFAKAALEQKGLRVIEVSFAASLKAACEQFLGWNPSSKDGEGRSLLQGVGSACREINPDFFANFVTTFLKAVENEFDAVLVSDLRYENELVALARTGYNLVHIQINRSGVESLLSESQKNHSSEHGLDNVSPDYEIYNNSTLDKLKENVEFVVSRHAGRRG